MQQGLDIGPGEGRALIRVADGDLALAAVLEMFARPIESPTQGVHPRAVVDEQAEPGAGVAVGALSHVGPRVRIGDGAMIGGGAIIKDHLTIGDGARLGGASAVMHDIPPGATWHGHPAHDAKATFREFAAIQRLPALLRALKDRTKTDQDSA